MSVSYHYLLMSNHLLLQKRLFSELKHTGLTLGQPKILDFLKDNNGVNQKDIASGCHMEPASLTSVLNGMEEKKLIERRMINGNRRSFHIFLTEAGEQLQSIIEQDFLLLEEKAFHGISDEERQQFMNTFLHIYKNMTEGSVGDERNL